MGEGMISSESPVLENGTPGLTSGGDLDVPSANDRPRGTSWMAPE